MPQDQPLRATLIQRVDNSRSVRLSWRSIAVTALISDVGLIAAIAIIASIGNNDALSTVALAVAVFSLITQLAVTFVQFMIIRAQEASSGSLARETSEALSEIRVTSRETRDTVASYVERLFGYVIGDLRDKADTPQEQQLFDQIEARLAEDLPHSRVDSASPKIGRLRRLS